MPRQAFMVASSFRPIRRARISCFPACVSKNHRPAAFFLSGTGKGKLSAPTSKISVPSSILRKRCMAVYFAEKALTTFLSSTGSPEEIISFESGPKIATAILGSPELAAAMSAPAASSGERNSFAVLFSDLLQDSKISNVRNRTNGIRERLNIFFSKLGLSQRRREPPPPPKPPEWRLSEPRALSSLDCQPLPPNADDPPLFSAPPQPCD